MNKKRTLRLWAVIFWLLVWQAASMIINQKLFLVSPVRVLVRLTELARTAQFWTTNGYSLARIFGGFLLALVSGILLAVLCACSRRAEELFAPVILAMKSVPVASFIILILLIFPSRYLSIIISFLMVFPMIYTNVMEGIRNTDEKKKEMAGLFALNRMACFRFLYVPEVYPYLSAACASATGYAFKAGVAAEVIGMPRGSIGERLQQAKVYLNTPDLLAWTVVIVVLSLLTGKLFLCFLAWLEKMITQTHVRASGRSRMKAGNRRERQKVRDDRECAQTSEGGEVRPENIRVSGLKKSYGGTPVLDGLSCEIASGEVTAVMGPSGEGKTTLFRLLAGLEQADAGEISGLSGKKLSAVFQEDRLFEYLDAAQNIRLVMPEKGSREQQDLWIAEALSSCGLPEGSQPVSEFSGGMRRRVSILRAVAACGDVCFLDEPFKGLDEATREQVTSWFLGQTRGETILLITHEPEEVRLMGCRDIIRLNEDRQPGEKQPGENRPAE